jgi:uncharacterized membrane protein YedE/YeeE
MDAYIAPVAGGLLIGGSAVLLLLFLGRLAGISGIVWAAFSGQKDSAWRWWFIVGLLGGPLLYHFLAAQPYPDPSPLPWWQALLAGGLVGFGVKMGSGCTSGHGVCGIGRLSPRSLVATCVFMVAGILTVFLTRQLTGGA